MNTRNQLTVVAVCALAGLSPSVAQLPDAQLPDAAPVSLTVEVRASGEAPILIELHDSEANWKKDTNPAAAITLPPGERRWIVKVPPGTYAARAFQDLNGDGELQKNRIGLPTEPFGFSRDAKPRFGPPSWGRTRFEVERDQEVTFQLIGGPKQAERVARAYEKKQKKNG